MLSSRRRPKLWARIDPVVDAGLEPLVVFDNTPWGFVAASSSASDADDGDGGDDDAYGACVGTYGNVCGPRGGAAGLRLYAAFASNVTRALGARYGRAAAGAWQYRVGTEPNYGGQ